MGATGASTVEGGTMRLAMLGLGRMGANMAKRLMRGGHSLEGFDLDPKNVAALAAEGAEAAASIAELAAKLPKPRVAWVMVPAGEPTDKTVEALAAHWEKGDIIIDGGNSHFKDDLRRSAALKAKGIHYLDAG